MTVMALPRIAKAEYKSVFGGTVHDQKFEQDKLALMEPQASRNLNNKLREYQIKRSAK